MAGRLAVCWQKVAKRKNPCKTETFFILKVKSRPGSGVHSAFKRGVVPKMLSLEKNLKLFEGPMASGSRYLTSSFQEVHNPRRKFVQDEFRGRNDDANWDWPLREYRLNPLVGMSLSNKTLMMARKVQEISHYYRGQSCVSNAVLSILIGLRLPGGRILHWSTGFTPLYVFFEAKRS